MDAKQSSSEAKIGQDMGQYKPKIKLSKNNIVIQDISSDTNTPGRGNQQEVSSSESKSTPRPPNENNIDTLVQMSKLEDQVIENNSQVNQNGINSDVGNVEFVPEIKESLYQSKKIIIEKYEEDLSPEKKPQQQRIEQQDKMQQAHSKIGTDLNLEQKSQINHQSSKAPSESNQDQNQTRRIHINSKIEEQELNKQVAIEPINQRLRFNFQQYQDIDINRQQASKITTQKAVEIKLFDQKFFQGRISVVWLFIIQSLDKLLMQQLDKLFENLVQKECQKLLSKYIQQAQRKFFHAQNSIFNVVIDLSNAQRLLQNKKYLLSKILNIYLYNNDIQNGIIRATNLKQRSRKIKCTYKDLTMIIKKAKLDIDNGNRFEDISGTITQIKYRSSFPAFIKLSNEDATQITQYRINLYGAIKLTDPQQRMEKLQQFVSLVRRVYSKNVVEMENLKEYMDEIDHIRNGGVDENFLLKKHKKVLQFYVRQSFYYKIMNNLLRTCRTLTDFKPLILPFNENYNAIKYLHNHYIKQSTTNNQNNWTTITYNLYRGAPLTKTQFQSLQIGDFIQLLGCISSSKNQKFVIDNFIRSIWDCLFKITIKIRRLRQDYNCFDHGFADLSLLGVNVPEEFKKQEEVLLNALNVYRVINKEIDKDGIKRITLEYGAIFDLLEKPEDKLSYQEKCVLLNYRFCMKQMNQIKDQGDVFMKLQQFDKAKQFNKKLVNKLEEQRIQLINQQFNSNQSTLNEARNNKLKQNQINTIQSYNKLSLAFCNCGQTDQARIYAAKSLKRFQRQMKKEQGKDRQLCKKIFEIHSNSLKTLTQTEDTPNLIKIINIEIQLLDEQGNWLKKAEKLIQRAQIYLKQGRIIQSEIDLKQSETILLTKINSFDQRRQIIHKNYYYKQLLDCCFKNSNLQDQRENQLQQVERDYQQYLKISNNLQQLLIKINQCQRNVALTVGDKKAYQECVIKGRKYFQQLDKRVTTKEKVAQIKVIQAKVENAIQKKVNIQKSYQLVGQAINIIQQISPNHEKLAQYNKILGQFQMNQYLKNLKIANKEDKKRKIAQKRLTPSEMTQMKDIYPAQSQNHILYNEQQHKKFDNHKKDLNDTTMKMMRGPEEQIDEIRRRQQEQERKKKEIQKEIQREIQRQNHFGLFNEPKYKPTYLSIMKSFLKALYVLIFNKTEQNPQVFEVKNKIGEVEYEFSNYKGGRQRACEVLESRNGSRHSEGAKAALLLAKVSLAQGQIKQAFVNIEKAHFILRSALVKEPNNPLYQQLYTLSPIFLQIQLYKCKIYNRQKKHDLALISITNLKDLGRKKLRDADGVGYLADIYEEIGNTLVNKGNKIQFETCYKKSIDLREKQMGKYNIQNAITNCSLAKYLVFVGDPGTAQNRVTDSFEIFSYFDKDHPDYWVQSSVLALLSQYKKQKKSELYHIRNSVRSIQKRLSKNSINLLKIKLKYAQVLLRNDQDQDALKIFKHLQRIMQDDVSLSQIGQTSNEIDNEKVAVRDVVNKSIRETTLRITNKNQLNLPTNDVSNKPIVNNQKPQNQPKLQPSVKDVINKPSFDNKQPSVKKKSNAQQNQKSVPQIEQPSDFSQPSALEQEAQQESYPPQQEQD